MAETIDAHHHLWRFRADEYAWLRTPEYTALRHDFLLPELQVAMREAGVAGSIAVQTRQSLEETRWLLALAGVTLPGDTRPLLRGVVGWAPLTAENPGEVLDELAGEPLLKGLRHIVQAEARGYLERDDFNRGIRAMQGRGLVYELLLLGGEASWQMEEAIALVDRHPGQSFVLDHAGKPAIRRSAMEPWAAGLRALAERANVTCKLSGLVTEADWATWTLDDLRPYLDAAVAAFGVERVMAGSDWPVCLVASSYERWWRTLRAYFADFSEMERCEIFGGVARRVYALGDGVSECR